MRTQPPRFFALRSSDIALKPGNSIFELEFTSSESCHVSIILSKYCFIFLEQLEGAEGLFSREADSDLNRQVELSVVASSVGASVITSVAPATTVASGSTLKNVDNNEERGSIFKRIFIFL
ncbi:uncharacterized protein LOC136080176 [Hydra vulgaris]|uniref:Uncharacterized protein LOC136080176 n=1 Tax=Hydra vulgaris TaxID=6087 RepID=A0ABM4BUK8_HYDVU